MATRKDPRRVKIAALNDSFRKNLRSGVHGQVLIAAGLDAEGAEFKAMVLTAVANMQAKDFKKANDPHGERDFNSFTIAAKLCLFKIDYYAKDDLQHSSPDPADAAATTRVMTLMLASEY